MSCKIRTASYKIQPNAENHKNPNNGSAIGVKFICSLPAQKQDFQFKFGRDLNKKPAEIQ
jgi:hypothetical protein